MIAALPVLTGREFELIAKVSVIWLALFFAAALIVLPWVLNWRDAARKSRLDAGDIIPISPLSNAPDQERIP